MGSRFRVVLPHRPAVVRWPGLRTRSDRLTRTSLLIKGIKPCLNLFGWHGAINTTAVGKQDCGCTLDTKRAPEVYDLFNGCGIAFCRWRSLVFEHPVVPNLGGLLGAPDIAGFGHRILRQHRIKEGIN